MTQSLASFVVFVSVDVASLVLRGCLFRIRGRSNVTGEVHPLVLRLLHINLREKFIDPLGIWLFAEQTLTVDEIMCLDVSTR